MDAEMAQFLDSDPACSTDDGREIAARAFKAGWVARDLEVEQLQHRLDRAVKERDQVDELGVYGPDGYGRDSMG